MAAITHQMAKEHLKSFFFLSNYLYTSCLALSDGGVSIQQIESSYNDILKKLCQQFPPAPSITGKNDTLDCHVSFLNKELEPKLEISLRGKNNK